MSSFETLEKEDSNGGLFSYAFRLVWLFFEQVVIMCQKHVSQKQRQGRQFWKDTVMIQFFTLAFVAYILYATSQQFPDTSFYGKLALPPLSTKGDGIFNKDAPGNSIYTRLSKQLFYAPDDHPGVQSLMSALKAKYPSVRTVGAASYDDILDLYQENLFDTWAAMVFTLDDAQRASGSLIPSNESLSTVRYSILVNPLNWGSGYETSNYTSEVYNELSSAPDLFWSTGYMTLQNFVATHLATQYDNVSPDYEVSTFVQRYPSSPVYDDKLAINIDSARNSIWKWIGPTLLSVCLFVPILSLLTEIVKERQYMMKDLLEISGLMNASYWFSYLVMILVIGQIAMWFSIGILFGFNILDNPRVLPYASLLTCYILGSGTFGMAFGFIVDRSEYFGLPVFLLTVALTVCGAYLGIADNINASLKLFFCFLSPSVALSMGVIVIESYLFHHGGDMDYGFLNENRNYPSLTDINGVILAATVIYFGIILLLPLDWLFRSSNSIEAYLASKTDEVKYPCDNEEEENENNDNNDNNNKSTKSDKNVLLSVKALSQIYPDGTHAVKDVSFDIKKGEVLSFLGANGAGKSTTMKMLCGTLDATYGDANVNGYSIMSQRTLARRNLGIAMQQDIIWDDVNVEDHLMLFGRLRGLHGTKLRTAVTEMAESLGFPDKRKALAGTLSGGQKRRLCVGLSMVGGNGVVYLDEPTAGLDPVSRRQLWELVQRNREGRAILLTTHFMDEADVLGDRIAIVKEGRLRALGSAKFLKNRFGLGYLLRMSLSAGNNNSNGNNASSDAQEGKDNNSNTKSNAQSTTVQRIVEFVRSFVPAATIASSAGTELSLRLPRDAVPVFSSLLEALETRNNELGIASFGIETTTLEEVFMRIVNEDNEQLLTNHDEANRLLTATPEERDRNMRELEKRDDKRNPLNDKQIAALLTQGDNRSLNPLTLPTQIAVMLKKRFFQFVRSRGQWAMGVLLPVGIAVAASLLLDSMPKSLIGSTSFPLTPSASSSVPVYVAGTSEAHTLSLINNAFTKSEIDPIYTGANYSSLYDTIARDTASGENITLNGVLYDSMTSFTVLYNASYPVNFPALVQGMLDAAVSNVTENLLSVAQGFSSLPKNKLDTQLNTGFFFAMLVSLIAGSFGAGLSIVVSGERVTLVKHQQLASGASSLAYWLGNFIFDSSLIFSFVLLFGGILAVFNPSVFANDGFGDVVLPGFFFTISSVFRFYSFSYFVSDVKLAQAIFFYGSLAVVFVLIDIYFNVLFVSAKGDVSDPAPQAIAYIFSLLDPSFGWYMVLLYKNNFLAILTQNKGADFFSPEIAGNVLLSMMGGALLYATLFVVFTENALGGLWNSLVSGAVSQKLRVKPMSAAEEEEYCNALADPSSIRLSENNSSVAASTGDEDSSRTSTSQLTGTGSSQDPDVVAERQRVKKIAKRGLLNPKLSAIFIHDLRKVYFARGSVPAKVAVKNVNISIPQGEIFGLLGANGAGKTTLLKIVSGQEAPTSGYALINGHDVVTHTNAAQRSMGLCPQFDTLIERLSVRENLLFFGRLKGLSGRDLVPVVEAFMQAMSIKRYEHKLIQQLSGGNRRKVSLAVALMGAPPTVYLDEPSTGLDPVASRLMWRLLSKISAAKSTAIVLTTHSMLECEAVCTRVCIMKLGEMVCLGDSQHLRSAHGTGFQLELHLKTPSAIEDAKKFVDSNFAGAMLIEEHTVMLNYEIPRSSIPRLSQTFRLLEENKPRLQIDDYVLSQSTLEQVFLKQIRPNAQDARNQQDQQEINQRVPLFRDYATAYLVWALAFFIPGLHHFYLGNFWRGVKYFFTLNEVVAGWLLDLFELHVLVQKSVQEKGHVEGFLFCSCCHVFLYLLSCCRCCGLCKKETPAGNNEEDEEQAPTRQ